ncbi:MAG: hypothetical protein ACRDHY_13860, partial [Anaerolineales bacterium]
MRSRRWAILAAIGAIAVIGTGVQSGSFGRIIIRAPIVLLRAVLGLNHQATPPVEHADLQGAEQRMTLAVPPPTVLSRPGQPSLQGVAVPADRPRQPRTVLNPLISVATERGNSLPSSASGGAGRAPSSPVPGAAAPPAGTALPASEISPDPQSAPAAPAPEPVP